MDGKSFFLRNSWYMAAWSGEVADAPLRRRLLGEPVLLMRREGGAVAALIDRCPHRFAPLSKGLREGDVITCAYHGLGFDLDGRCVRNPFSSELPKGAQVRSFPVIERDGIVWLWAGEAAAADPALVPDFSMLQVPGHGAPISGLLHMNAPCEYGIDNLMDLSHIEFVHRGSFAGRGVIFAGTHTVHEEGRQLHSNWWMPGVLAPPHTFGVYDPQMRCDHWLDMRWEPAASMYLQVGACPPGAPRSEGLLVHQAHILTPETPTSAHYFWATTRTLPPSEEGDAMLAGLMEQAFRVEDKPLIEAAYQNLDGASFWDSKPVFLGVDAGGARARRRLEQLIQRENAP
jgi:phenylpropionate dioxygenase-like ring-hydroxylating dioxygenase large terminal subunit